MLWAVESELIKHSFDLASILATVAFASDIIGRTSLKIRLSRLARGGVSFENLPKMFPIWPSSYLRLYGFIYSRQALAIEDRQVRAIILLLRIAIPVLLASLVYMFVYGASHPGQA